MRKDYDVTQHLTFSEQIANAHEANGDYDLAAIHRMTESEKHNALVFLSWTPHFENAIRYVAESRARKAERDNEPRQG